MSRRVVMAAMVVFFLLLLSVAFGAAGVLGLARWRRGDTWLGATLIAVATAWFGFMILAVLGAVLPDALDRLPEQERRRVVGAVHGGATCGNDWPLTRVTHVAVHNDGGTVEWRCAWTILGKPAWSGHADCIDGKWIGTGYLAERHYGRC